MFGLLKYFYDQGSQVYAGLLSARLKALGRDEGQVDSAWQADCACDEGPVGHPVLDVLYGGQQTESVLQDPVLGVVLDERDQLRCRIEGAREVDRRNIEAPSHYTQGKVEAWDVMENNICRSREAWVDYLACTAYKYIHRAPHKGKQAEDYGKAIYCLQRAIEALKPSVDEAVAWANEDPHSIPRGIETPTWIASDDDVVQAFRNLQQQQQESKYEKLYRDTARRELFGETPDVTNKP